MRDCHSNHLFIGWIVLLLCLVGTVQAQKIAVRDRFSPGEEVEYELYFKWGLLMPRAGVASLSIQETEFEKQPAFHYRLLFRTTGVIEKVYSMRDTIDCHFSPEMLLLQSEKRVNDDDYYLVDRLRFSYQEEKVQAHSLRYTRTRTKIDTLLVSEAPYMFDMLGAALYLRSLDWEKMESGDQFPFQVAIGRDVVNISFRYTGQKIVEREDYLKYRTRHFYIDIYDEAFTQSKAAAEIWVGDDENHIPIKIRAKLKIGAAEVYYKNSQGLRYPFTSRVEMKRK
ncbi:MAG: DUF3108 domain-containing protein [Parabacteroides sp.]|nr:DUF3108 domain-containing protein [Parabacteroides sp.]